MRIILLLSLLFIENATEDLDEGWVAVQRTATLYFNMEQYSLEIKTDSTLGSKDMVRVFFYTSQLDVRSGGLFFDFSSSPQYAFFDCSSSRINLPTDLPTATDKVWRVTLTRTSGIRLVVHCNEVEVVNTLMSDSTCRYSPWSTRWSSREVAKIRFESSDTASDYYQPQGGCVFRRFKIFKMLLSYIFIAIRTMYILHTCEPCLQY